MSKLDVPHTSYCKELLLTVANNNEVSESAKSRVCPKIADKFHELVMTSSLFLDDDIMERTNEEVYITKDRRQYC